MSADNRPAPLAAAVGSAENFIRFVALWNRLQGQQTPRIHPVMADFLCRALGRGYRYVYLVAFRNSGKSTLIGLFIAWLLKNDPELRALVITADILLSIKMVRHARSVAETHPHMRGAMPKRGKDKWAENQFTVTRRRQSRDPSVLARALGANFTGSRADIIICDDIEVPSTCSSAYRRKRMRDKIAEVDYVLEPGGAVVFIGTPHAKNTIYYERGLPPPIKAEA